MDPDCLSVDFGTTNTVAVVASSHAKSAEPLLERMKLGNEWRLPSAVFWAEDAPVVGFNALRSRRLDASRFVRCPKREMGHASLSLGDGVVPVSDVVAAVLQAVRDQMVVQLGRVPARVVLTLPVQWARTRRAMFAEAVNASGFTDVEFLEEPVAAAVRLASLGRLPDAAPFAVLDFGGGTLDVAVVERAGAEFEVLVSDGADPLGGEDIDDLIFAYVVATSTDREAARELDQSADPMWSIRRDAVRDNCRQAKEQLSEQDHGDIDLPHTGESMVLSRERFDAMAGPVLQRAVGTLEEAVRESGLDVSAVPVYLVGGSSRIPALSEIIRARMGCLVHAIGDPQFVVSEGAALWAARRPSAGRRQLPFEQLRERFPDQWAATEEASRQAAEALRIARQRALEAGERARAAAKAVRGTSSPPGKTPPTKPGSASKAGSRSGTSKSGSASRTGPRSGTTKPGFAPKAGSRPGTAKPGSVPKAGSRSGTTPPSNPGTAAGSASRPATTSNGEPAPVTPNGHGMVTALVIIGLLILVAMMLF
jgi:actin-like ATPase involved in cell morphogenesis